MSAEPALVVEPEHDGGDDPPDGDLLALFGRVIALVNARGPIFAAAVDRAFEAALCEDTT